jgi:hypothetical protein
LQSKNLQLKNGRDAAIPGVLRSKTPQGQTAKRFGPRKGLSGNTGTNRRAVCEELERKPGFLRGEPRRAAKNAPKPLSLIVPEYRARFFMYMQGRSSGFASLP